MRSLLLGCLLISITAIFLFGCSGSSSPITPDNLSVTGSHQAAIEAALNGVEVQNTNILSIKLAGHELLPWGLIDVMLSGEGTFPLEISLADPDYDVTVEVSDATLFVDGNTVESYTGLARGNLAIGETSGRMVIHIVVPGETRQTRDITVRTVPSTDWPTIQNLGVEKIIDSENGIDFDIAVRELLVGAIPGTPIEIVESVIGSLDCELLRALPNIDAYRVRIPDGADYGQYMDLFECSSAIKYAEYNSILYPCLVPNDTYENQEYGNDLMQLYEAWDIHTGTNSTILAIVDSGAMRDHPDLYENIIPGEDFINPIGDGLGGETPGNGLDEDNDGYPDGNVGHGTHCSGIMGAVGNNDEGVSGHTWHTQILPCRVFPTDGDNGANDSDIADAIMWAADQGAIGISMSLGSSYGSGTESSAINYAWNHGSVIIAAAGNNNSSSNFYPAAYTNVIAVAATTQTDKKASFSNYGSYVDCCAPGYEIISSIFYEYSGDDPWSVPENQRYAVYSGTSMACPQVTGLVGLVKSYFPSYTNAEVADQVVFTADNIDSLNPSYIGQLGTGRINDFRALTTPLAPDFEIIKFSSDDDNPLYSQGNRDGFLNPGEIIEFQPMLRNIGTRSAPNCTMSLEGGDGYIWPLTSSVNLGFFDRGETKSPDAPVIFRIDPSLTADTILNASLHFEYDDGDPVDVPITLIVRTDLGIVDIITCSGQGFLADEIRKGITGVTALEFTIEGDLNYGTLDELVLHQTGTAPASSFTPTELWLDADDDGVFIPERDTKIAYRSYDHPGYRGSFDDLNDPEAGYNAGIDYEEFPPVYFDGAGVAHFYDCVVPTAPGVPRTIFVVIGILPTATSGDTVQIGILSTDDVIVRAPDQVSPIGLPIQTDEVPIVGTWLDPGQLTDSGNDSDTNSWRAETAVCPVTGNVYCVFDSNQINDFDVFIMRSTNEAESFENAVRLDPSEDREFYPDVQVDSLGVLHVVYYSTQIADDNREIFYVRSSDNGQTWDTPVRLTNATRDSRVPKLAIGPGDSINVAWHDNRTGTNDYEIYYKRSDDGGDTWGDDVMIANTNPVSQEAAIAVGGDGVIHIAWEEPGNYYNSNVRYSRSTDDGVNWSAPLTMSTGTYANHGAHADVGADNGGHVYFVYHYSSWGTPSEVIFRTSDNSGTDWSSNVNLTNNSISDSQPNIYVRPDGSFIDIVYRCRETESWNIRHIYSDDGLATWSDPFQVSQSAEGGAREPVVVRAANHNIFAFWEDIDISDGSYEVFWNRYLY